MSQNMGRALRQFTFGKGKSAGRNSSGCITIFHRGGGAKRLQRKIDMKRNTSSIGIVERIEYDPNRSSKIALVRWTEGVQPDRQMKCNTIEEFVPPCKILEPITTTIGGTFLLSSLSGKVDQRKLACFSPGLMASYVVVGQPTRMPHLSKNPFTSESGESKKTSVKEVLLSALSSQKDKGKTAFVFPRIAVAGAKPAFCAQGKGDELGGKNSFSLSEVKKWKPDSILWAHRIKRKAALSWGGNLKLNTSTSRENLKPTF